jgi:hypothetical protein
MNFKPNQGYSLRFFSTGAPSEKTNPQGEEIITIFPEIMIFHVFEEMEEGFVIIREFPDTKVPDYPDECYY